MGDVTELDMVRFVKDAHKIALMLVDEADGHMTKENAREAGMCLAQAWIILNGGAVLNAKMGFNKMGRLIEQLRNRIRSRSAPLESMGCTLMTNFSELGMAFLIKAEEKGSGRAKK